MKPQFTLNGFALCFLFVIAGFTNATAQSTFNRVYTLLQSNCTGCHGGSNPVVFSLEGSETDVYNAIVNGVPQNSAAAANGDKLIFPGHPYRSFLLKKIGSFFDSNYLALGDEEGSPCPQSQQSELEDADIELVRQWIIRGAMQSGVAVDYQMLVDYYTIGGLPFVAAPPAPAPGEGFQLRFGPLFLKPGEEKEFMKKEHLENTEMLKVWKLEGRMTIESHHMLLFQYPDDAPDTRHGTRLVPTEAVTVLGLTLANGWQDDSDLELPSATAIFWQPGTTLDFDYHIKNYSTTEILPNDFYLNVYYDNSSARYIEMKSDLVNEFVLVLPQGVQTRTSTINFPENRYLYMLTSHTHKYGIDYDFYLNNNGSKGEQIYEGFYNVDYTFNQGFYDWEHPAVRYFEPLKDISGGLIYETKWDVKQPLVTFGLTTDDEMMLFYYSYTTEPLPQPASAPEIASDNLFHVAPNPFSNNISVNYTLSKSAQVELNITNCIGQQAHGITHESMQAGSHQEQIILPDQLPAGIYMLHLLVDGQTHAIRKIVKMN